MGRTAVVPKISIGDEATASLLRGACHLSGLLARTLGPHGRAVIATTPDGVGCPQLLTRGGAIARRVIEIENAFDNMGMLVARHAACRVDAEVRDGVATTAVIFERIAADGFRLIAAGYPTTELIAELTEARSVFLEQLKASRLDIEPSDAAAAVVRQMINDANLAEVTLRAAEGVGANGWLDVREGFGCEPTLEFVEGYRAWADMTVGPNSDGLLSGSRSTGPCRVIVTEDPIADLREIAMLTDRLASIGVSCAVVIAPTFASAVAEAVSAQRPGSAISIYLLGLGAACDGEILADLAAYAGTRPVGTASGDVLSDVPLADLGRARRVWFTASEFGMVSSGNGDRIGDRLAGIRYRIDKSSAGEERESLRRRAAALTGASASVALPGLGEAESTTALDHVRSAFRAAQLAMAEGVVAGGGAALARASKATGPSAGARILAAGAAEPLRQMANRAGYSSGSVLETVLSSSVGTRLDYLQNRWLDADSREVLDPYAVIACAVEVAVSTAVAILRTSVLVRRNKPTISLTP